MYFKFFLCHFYFTPLPAGHPREQAGLGGDDGQVGVSGDRLYLAEERLGLAGQANSDSL